MNDVLVELNHIQTYLLTWGNVFNCDGQDLIICITGNPGLPDFYREFAAELHRRTTFPVCVLGHAGHSVVPEQKSNILKNQEYLFNLEAQIQHKLDLINKVDKKSKLHLIGHSIGAWMILEAIQKKGDLVERISSVNLLFPTIQHLVKTRNGKYLNNIVRNIHILVLLLFHFLYVLPNSIRLLLVNLYLKAYSLPSYYTERLLKYLNPKICEKMLFLAYDELDSVNKLNNAVIDKIKHVTNVIYSKNDDWVPISYMLDLKCFQPQLQMKEVDVTHVFVLKSSERVAEMVSDFIKIKS